MQTEHPGVEKTEFKVIRNVAELKGKLLQLDEEIKISEDALRPAFDTFAMDFSQEVPEDPYSIGYRNKQFEIYELVAGKPYGVENEVTLINAKKSVRSPFPYYTESCETVGNHLMCIGL